MTREEFCKYHWEYFLVLERDLMEIDKLTDIEFLNKAKVTINGKITKQQCYFWEKMKTTI